MRSDYWEKRLTRRSLGRSVALGSAGLGAVALVGCGDDDDDGPAPGGSPTGAASRPAGASATATAAPRRGGVLNFPVGGQPPHQDVHRSNSAYMAGFGLGAAYSSLVKPQATGHKNALIVSPDLAEKWEQPDATTYVFKLRPNAKFHNIAPVNGRTANAEDVAYSFKRQIAEKINASFLVGTKEITVVDPLTVRITTDSPSVDYLGGFTDPRNKVVAKEAVELKGNLEEGPTIGTGPWIFKEWKRDTSTSFTRNPEYFVPGLPYADELFMPYSIDAARVEAQFAAGQISMIGSGGTTLAAAKFKAFDPSKFVVYSGPVVANIWTMLNQEFPQFKDQRVRKALSLAIDRQLVLANANEGIGQLDAIGMLFPGPDWQLPKEELAKLLPYDPKAAKALLEQAGGIPKQVMPTFEGTYSRAAGQIVQANWKAIDFETEIKIIAPIELNGTIFNPAVAKYSVATTAISHAPTLTGDLESWLLTGGNKNGFKLSDPELDRLIRAQKAEFDEKKRRELVFQIQRLVIDKAYYIPLGAQPTLVAHRTTTHNVQPLTSINGLNSWYMEVWFDA